MVAGKIAFGGPVVFSDNNAEAYDGGAVYLLSFSQLVLQTGGHLYFTNNTGRLA